MALTQKQLEANRRNAVKGGRPKGVRSIEKEKMKDYIAQKVAEHGEEIVAVLLGKMREGDIAAIRELFDRGFGKPSQEVRNEISGSINIHGIFAALDKKEENDEKF